MVYSKKIFYLYLFFGRKKCVTLQAKTLLYLLWKKNKLNKTIPHIKKAN